MLIPYFETEQFINFLKNNGCEMISHDYAEDDGFLVFEKDDLIVPIQMRKHYTPTYVCKVCEELDIVPPLVYKKISDQLEVLRKRDQG